MPQDHTPQSSKPSPPPPPSGTAEMALIISRLMAHYWTADELAGVQRAIAGDWLDDLREFSVEAVSQACTEWRREQTRKPKIADIRKLAREAQDRLSYRRDRALPKPEPTQDEAWAILDHYARNMGYPDPAPMLRDYAPFSVKLGGTWFRFLADGRLEHQERPLAGERRPAQRDPVVGRAERQIIEDHWHLLHDIRAGRISVEEGLSRYRAARAAAGLPVDDRSPAEMLPETERYKSARRHNAYFDAEQEEHRRQAAEHAALQKAQAGIKASEQRPGARAATAEAWGRALGEDAPEEAAGG